MILIASICFSGSFKICYMRNKKKDEKKLFIKETKKTWTIKHFGHVKEHGLYRKQTKFKRHVFMKYGSLGLWASSCPWQLQLAQPPPQPGWTDSVNLCFAKPFFPTMSATFYVYSCSVESKLQAMALGCATPIGVCLALPDDMRTHPWKLPLCPHRPLLTLPVSGPAQKVAQL